MISNSNNGKNSVAPEAIQALNQMKAEAARELDIADYQAKDRGNLTSRQNGYVGGFMAKKSVDLNDQMANKGTTTSEFKQITK